MKKRFMGLLAMASMLFATSCSEDVVLSQSTGDEVKVTFTTELRNDVKSRTVGDDTDHIDQLYFRVYQNGELLPLLSQTLNEEDFKSGENGTKKATIEVVLVKGQTYSFAFWAQNSEYTAYRFDENTAKVEIDLNSVQTNNRAGDAFFKSVIDHKVNGTFSQEITLKRPFAQVNFLTTEEDLQKAEKAGFIPTQSNIKIENVASELNVLTGEVNNGQYVELHMGQLLKQTGGVLETTKIQGSNVEYRYLATAYVLPTDPKNPVKVNASMEVDGGTGVNTFLAVENIDIQRNYRTNIYGNLLTDNGTFNVTIDPGFNEPETNFPGTDAEKLAYAAKNGGTVELANDVELDEPLMVEGSMVLNMESYNLNGSILVAAGGNLTINGGTISNELFTDYSSIESKGSLTLNNVNVSSIRHAVRIESGSAVINGGNYTIISKQGRTQHALNVSGNSNVIVKGGTFDGPKGTISDSGAAVNVQSGSTVTIEGGSFSKGKNKTLANAGTLIVKGGSFDQDPSSYVADGCTVLKDGNGYIVVAEDEKVAVSTSNAEDFEAALASGNVNEINLATTIDKGTMFAYDVITSDRTINFNNNEVKVGGGYDKANGFYGYGFFVEECNVTFNDANIVGGGFDVYKANVTYNGSHTANWGESTSRYSFAVAGNSTLTLNGGEFKIIGGHSNLYYAAVDATSTLYITGGKFHKQVWKNAKPFYILSGGKVIITGGEFAFDPSSWVPTDTHQVTRNEEWWIVSAK